MIGVLGRRLLSSVAALAGVSVVIFLLLSVLPGDPLAAVVGPEATQADRDRLARDLGLSDPLPVQYVRWISRVARGDLGESLARRRPVIDLVVSAYTNTALLACAAAVIGLASGILLGALAAATGRRWPDRLISVVSVLALSVPSYWLAILLIILFSARLRLLPASGMHSGDGGMVDLLRHLIMPAIAASAVTAGLMARITRASLLDLAGEPFVLALRAKGLGGARILLHIAKNAAPPVLAVAGLQVGYLLGGSVLVETIFSWPGLGQLIVQSIAARDLGVVQSAVLAIALTFVLVNFAIDLVQIAVNPRLRRTA